LVFVGLLERSSHISTRAARIPPARLLRMARAAAMEHDDPPASGSDSDSESDDGLGGKSLYEILNVEKTASASEIKRAYHKAALRLHPDKNPSPDAAAKFQTLQKVYGVLGDEEKRKVYDETGRTEDAELSGDSFKNLYEYYRGLYRKVTEDDVDAFFQTYRGSEEERQDVVNAYEKFQGDMSKVFMWVMCSEEAKDAHRFADMVTDAIADGSATSFEAFTEWARRVRLKPAPKDPLGIEQKKKPTKTKDDTNDLAALILARRETRADDLFASLEAKYGGAKKKARPEKEKKKGGAPSANGGVAKKKK
jgi:DnaJ family protein C protein 9